MKKTRKAKTNDNDSMEVVFTQWRYPYPQKKWNSWLQKMHSRYSSIWKQAGIHQAILNSTHHKIPRHNKLLFAFAQKWSPSTNTFLFPWGEITITLLDIFVLGGFSLLGHNVHDDDDDDDSSSVIIQKLLEARSQISRSKAQKACQYHWLNLFIDSGSEIEHQAFLALWLSRFVFPSVSRTIHKQVLPIAVRLAKGTKLALAPPVLASIYRDLRLFKHTLDASANQELTHKSKICAPLQLLQIWVWERFPSLTPTKPNLIKFGDPRFSRWDNVKKLKNVDVFLDLEHGRRWCPYANESFSPLYKVYGDKEKYLSVESGLDDVFQSFARCLRIAHIVGLENNIEHYFPHRVMMQFGMDQDVPVHVTPDTNITREAAWENYTRPFQDEKLYLPSRFTKPKVSGRYLEWWNQSNFSDKNGSAAGVEEKKSTTSKSSRTKLKQSSSNLTKAGKDPIVPPGFPPICSSTGTSDKEDKLTLTALFQKKKTKNYKQSEGCDQLLSPVQSSTAGNENIKSDSRVMSVGTEYQTKVFADTEEKTEKLVSVDTDAEEGSCSQQMINEPPQLELEARISWIEQAIAEIKRAKLGNRNEEARAQRQRKIEDLGSTYNSTGN